VPKEALAILSGYSIKISVHVKIDQELKDVEIDTKDMNILELACATSSAKVV